MPSWFYVCVLLRRSVVRDILICARSFNTNDPRRIGTTTANNTKHITTTRRQKKQKKKIVTL